MSLKTIKKIKRSIFIVLQPVFLGYRTLYSLMERGG